MVKDMTRVWGLRPTTIEGVALVTQLAETGSDPPADSRRSVLLDDMKRRGVERPGSIVALPTTSLVLVRTQLPPGVQAGDRLDVEVMIPTRSETTSLRNGWLMQTRLQEMAVLGNRIRSGRVLALAEGAVVVNSLLENNDDPVAEVRGRILGGAVATKDRSLGLVLKSDHHSVQASALVAAAINKRFHTYDRGTKRGVATPKRDSFIQLAIHQAYRDNLVRYVRVVQSVALRETPHARLERIERLSGQLLEPRATLQAAMELEAIGTEASDALAGGLTSDSPLVRFAAAEALGYLGDLRAIEPLMESARDESAFRKHALTVLGAMNEPDARHALAQLLHSPSDETRYGAFRTIQRANPQDPAVRGHVLANTLALHHVPTDATPLVHVRRTERPEIVIFATAIKLQTPMVLFCGKRMMVRDAADGRLRISRFAVGQSDIIQYCDNDLAGLIVQLVEMGASYTDVVGLLVEAKQKGAISARLKFDALPKSGRQYDFVDQTDPSTEPPAEGSAEGAAERLGDQVEI